MGVFKKLKEKLFGSIIEVFKDTKKIVLLGVLSALGSILMLIEIPYPPVPFLKFDVSDLPVLLTAQALGVGPAVLVAIIKSLVSLMVRGIRTPMGIGLITAAISSMALAFLYVTLKKRISGTKWYEKASLFFIVIFLYSAFMTLANFLFITPIFLGGLWFKDVMDFTTLSVFLPNLTFTILQPITLGETLINLPTVAFSIPDFGYTATIIFIYMPFNALKGFMVLALYEATSRRLLPELKKILKLT